MPNDGRAMTLGIRNVAWLLGVCLLVVASGCDREQHCQRILDRETRECARLRPDDQRNQCTREVGLRYQKCTVH